jgi:ribosomal protein S18 acetylase RimI-like enzyme
MAIDIKVLRSGDEAVLMNVAAEVFDNPVDPKLAREFLADPRHHIAVAIDDGLVVGFASGLHYVHPDKPAEFWVNEVAVAPTHHRRGLARAVMRTLLDAAKAQGCHNAWVLTNRDNPAAMGLYAALGGVKGEDAMGDDIIGYDLPLRA